MYLFKKIRCFKTPLSGLTAVSHFYPVPKTRVGSNIAELLLRFNDEVCVIDTSGNISLIHIIHMELVRNLMRGLLRFGMGIQQSITILVAI